MPIFGQSDLPIFEKKLCENFHAAKSLFDKGQYNASANRLYYTFVNLGYRNLAMFDREVDETLFIVPESSNNKIDKSRIKKNPRGLKINDPTQFTIQMNRAESVRVKADYTNRHVVKEDIEGIFEKTEKLIELQGIKLWATN